MNIFNRTFVLFGSIIAFNCVVADPASSSESTKAYSRAPAPGSTLAKDGSGRITKFRDAAGQEQECLYDNAGHPISVFVRDGQKIIHRTLLGYDKQGRLSIVKFPSGYTVYFEYPESGGKFSTDGYGNHIELSPPTLQGAVRIGNRDVEGRLESASKSVLTLHAWLMKR